MRDASASTLRVERLDPDLLPVYRAMTSVQRVVAGLSATDLIRDRLRVAIREANPARSEEMVAQAVSCRIPGARG